ncbi:MAG: SDR family NAD(P)-dependent oxidoreductase [Glaciimonas sp.]|nr:SDR family NAD(P)-dependent oxidoreductase [Glaciimonas sp.]
MKKNHNRHTRRSVECFLISIGSSGLGAATARMIIQEDGQVIIADLNQAAGNALAKELGDRVYFIDTDVSSEISFKTSIDTAVTVFGGLHGLINWVPPTKKVLGKDGAHNFDDFACVIQINLIGTFNMLRLEAEAISKTEPNTDGERGVIINTASVATFDGQIGQAAYASSKGGVVALTLPVARKLGRFGIRVMTIAPGIMEIPMLPGMPTKVQEARGKMVPFPSRMGRPAEFALLVKTIFENAYLNGEVIRLDGSYG